MNPRRLDRRQFLRHAEAGLLAWGIPCPPLAWGEGRAAPGKEGLIRIPTREFYGDSEERLEIPSAWNLQAYHMAGSKAPVLQGQQIRRRLEEPIGTRRLAEIVSGKRTVIITFDDLTRPTPTGDVLPYVLAELKRGGIKDDGIIFLVSYGAHRALLQDEAERKIGAECVGKYPWLNHNIYENLADLGRTSRGNRIKVNRHFVQADVRITISGIKAHPLAGYGGGAKAVLPGVAWIESIDFFHRTIAGVGGNRNPTVGMLKVFKNECRLDMVEAARLARVDFSVQVIYNGYRKVIGLHAGDIVQAHHAACREAHRLLRTDVAQNVDLVLVNAYPQNLQAANSLHWARACVREGGSAVLIIQNPQGLESWHFARERWNFDARPFYETAHPHNWDVKQAGQLIVYSAYLQKRDMVQFPARTIFTRTWADTVAAIRKAQRGELRAALYPYGGIQHPPGALDG